MKAVDVVVVGIISVLLIGVGAAIGQNTTCVNWPVLGKGTKCATTFTIPSVGK